MRGQKGDFLHDSTGNTLLEFFSKAGSLFEKKETFYEDTSVIKLFKPAFKEDPEKATKLMFWLRDCRG